MKHGVFVSLTGAAARAASLAAMAVSPGGCGDTPAPLPACTATMPAGTAASVGPDGSSVCSEAGGVTLAKDADLSAEGYTVVGPAFTVSGSGPFAHGLDVVLPYDSGK